MSNELRRLSAFRWSIGRWWGVFVPIVVTASMLAYVGMLVAVLCPYWSIWFLPVIEKRQTSVTQYQRLAGYCCPALYDAVESPRQERLKLALELNSPANYEGAHNWKLRVAASDHFILVNYCPFCGEYIKTPDLK